MRDAAVDCEPSPHLRPLGRGAWRQQRGDDGCFLGGGRRAVCRDKDAAHAAGAAAEPEDDGLIIRVRGALEAGRRLDHCITGRMHVAARGATQLPIRGHAEICGVPARPQRLDLVDDGRVGHATTVGDDNPKSLRTARPSVRLCTIGATHASGLIVRSVAHTTQRDVMVLPSDKVLWNRPS